MPSATGISPFAITIAFRARNANSSVVTASARFSSRLRTAGSGWTASAQRDFSLTWGSARLHMPDGDVLAGDRVDHRGGEPLTQPALRVRVLAGPLPPGRQSAGVQV